MIKSLPLSLVDFQVNHLRLDLRYLKKRKKPRGGLGQKINVNCKKVKVHIFHNCKPQGCYTLTSL